MPQVGAQIREGAVERELSRRRIQRRAFEQQPDCEVSAQGHSEVARRYAIGPFLDLTHDAGPSTQGQEFGAQIILPLVIGDTELSQGVCNGVVCAPTRVAVVSDQARECSRPLAALRRQRRAVELQEAAMDAAVPLGQGPVRQALIEVAREESNQRWMDPGIGVDAVHGQKPVAMASRSGHRRNRRRAGATNRLDTGGPEAVHRSPLLARTIVHLTQSGR